jgi:hypothetical protein
MRSLSTRASGFLILLAGLWGGLIPFVGPYFHFTLGPDKSWTWTSGRLYLDVLPAAAAVLGGLILLGFGPHLPGRLGALLALAAGAWFAVGPDVSQLWHAGGVQGAGHGSRDVQMLEMLTFHTGLGVLVTALAAWALPGKLRPRGVAAAQATPGTASAGRPAPATERAPAPTRDGAAERERVGASGRTSA